MDAETAVSIAAADEYGIWMPWRTLTSVRTRGWFPRWFIDRADGGTIRLTIRQGPHSAAMRLLADALDDAGIDAALNFPDEPRRVWARRSLVVALIVFFATATPLLTLTWNNESDIRERALERWGAGEYAGEHPVALIAAEAIVDQRLRWFSGEPRLYEVSHDEVLVDMSDGRSRYGGNSHCWRLAREDGNFLGWNRLGRAPCDRNGFTPAGVEGLQAEAWLDGWLRNKSLASADVAGQVWLGGIGGGRTWPGGASTGSGLALTLTEC